MNVKNAWLFPVTQPQFPSLRLFCFPYAGGGAQAYCSWARVLPGYVNAWALQPPGRGSRLTEAPLRSIRDVALGALAAMRPLLDVPFALFGHSMGALVAFEVSRALRASGGPSPVHLLLSGTGAPDLPALSGPLHRLPEDTFIERLREYNGTPREVLEHRELMALLIPLLRADFEACETYECEAQPPLDTPITLFSGEDDTDTPPHYLEAWGRHTTRPLRTLRFPGDHFFWHTSSALFLSSLVGTLNGIAAGLSDHAQYRFPNCHV